ncbi:hypothetical protein [Mycolicibacterium hodleri]|uniref:Uncharacterized protein n=1 Tax=Mycolicibacterium hodleri TaxID=49897 RepID=A0A502EEG3_9MYCO|nr:hypothetical protein [Mycolicibacterium hodleri]TPG35847.1 hypothetical protein EAH80_07320 [Mycolicibacterium hodleri]
MAENPAPRKFFLANVVDLRCLVRILTADEQQLAYRFAHLPLPNDAVSCDPWSSHGEGDWRRYFLTRVWDIAGIWVEVAGEQNHHGEITRWLHIGGEGQCDTSDRERLIAAITEAGELYDQLHRTIRVSE